MRGMSLSLFISVSLQELVYLVIEFNEILIHLLLIKHHTGLEHLWRPREKSHALASRGYIPWAPLHW